MQAFKIQLKVYADAPAGIRLEAFVPVFHRFIKEQRLDETLIDVADYSHVHHGPGILLEGHGSDYYADLGEGRLGLLYSRKRDAPVDPAARLPDAFRRAFTACALLEAETGLGAPLRFRTDELLLRVVDRLRAPNTAEAAAALEPELRTFLKRLFDGGDVSLVHEGTPKDPLTLRIRAPGAGSVGALVERLKA